MSETKKSPSRRLRLLALLLVVIGAIAAADAVYLLYFAWPPVQPGGITKQEIRRLVGKDDAVVLDIGANDGSDTRELLAAFPTGRVYAFEPDPRAIRRFRAATQDPRAVLFEVAVGASDGTTEFYASDAELNSYWSKVMPEGWDQSGSILKPKAATEVTPWVQFKRTIQVKLVRLDTWAKENAIASIDFMWVDIQGAERDLILGAPEILQRTRYLYTEYSDAELYEGEPTLKEIAALLPDFKLIKRWPTNALFRNKRLD